MDPTLLAALAGILGAVIGSILGGVFALKATKRQVEVMLEQARGDVNERLYSQSLEIMRFFAKDAELRPYFYDNKDLSKAETEFEKLKALSAEMVSGFYGVSGVATRATTGGDSTQMESLYSRRVQLQQRPPRTRGNLCRLVRR